MAFQRVLCLALLCHGVIAAHSPERAAAPRKLHGRFLHITDLHPDQFYKVHSSTLEADACHHGKGPAGTYGAETSDCDSPYALVNATFDWIGANLKDQLDFVIWTGDSARHDSDEQIPRSPAQVLGTNRWIADKFVDLFADPSGQALQIPIIPTFGNNDILPHNILLPGPNKWLQYYTDIWRRFIPEEQRHSFEFGGWFYVEVIPNRLAVFSLNTLYFFDRNAGVDDCATPSEPGFKQMEWLRIQLQFMRARGMKAILMGHVPPARTESKKLWDETCWQKYTLWLRQYRDVVTASLYGHMNVDHFLIQDTRDIDMSLISGGEAETADVREAMEDELSAASTADYLQELRHGWSKLPRPSTDEGEASGGKGKKGRKGGKKPKGLWGERYHMSLVSPSVVPNYFPTLRVIEYNISGLEDTPVWEDKGAEMLQLHPVAEVDDQKHLDLRDMSTVDTELGSTKEHKSGDKDKKKKKKPKKGKKPQDPSLVIPDPPSTASPPGPAYSQQTLTLTGYTQYFANLTHINNDMTPDGGPVEESEGSSSWTDWLLRWRKGKNGDKKPKTPDEPNPRAFQFEVEYSTFDDKIYKLGDLTVNSFVDLAYRIGQKAQGKALAEVDDNEDRDIEEESEYASDASDESDSDDDDEFDETTEQGDKDKKKKKGKKHNKTWLHFLRHAFVSTVDDDDLEKFL
ncbi:Metallo-dependent phosphatase-like protein [Diplogelasinospora grovesii]|uniref:Endopolyphosphatase n=1 Tax=Diplogelasinospora grovesii TaxID=303347 RepID=A0AAN6MZM4_9PEZI|nr:Metallo-dependent phosphatase-like protein [Diplogelasinospora grovesii]